MTELLAHIDAYLQEFEATVSAVNVEEKAIALDRTAFYPGGGGQPCDLGWINGQPVTKVKRDGEHIWHWLAGDLPAEGASVHPNRVGTAIRLMRTHTPSIFVAAW